jgi:short-subunit dehydrogenase
MITEKKHIYPGATSGLGYEFEKLLPKKYNLILIARNAENLKKK